jgi:PilZ domain
MHSECVGRPSCPPRMEEPALNGFPQGRQLNAIETRMEPQRAAPAEKATALRRQHERRSAAITALVHCHGRFQTVSILDISAGGLQLQGAFGVTGGDRIAIELLSGHRLTAKVVWSMGSRVGAAFSPLLAADDPGLVALQRSVGGTPDAPAPTRA